MNTSTHEEKLKALLVSVTAALQDIAVHNPETDDWEVMTDGASLSESDTDLLADAAEDADERVTELAELENHYNNITRALAKIATGTYGRCEIGGELIEEPRLDINPAARTCTAHMESEYELPLS